MQIIPIKYGKSTLPESAVFLNSREATPCEIVFKIYLVKIDCALVLIDAGCETMPGFEMRNFIGAVAALKNINVEPEQITDVILTHSHHDHIECVKYFKNALVHIQREEYESARAYIPENMRLNIFMEEYMLYNAIKIKRIGGHTSGSCIVEIADGDKIFVFAGDECYTRECLAVRESNAQALRR